MGHESRAAGVYWSRFRDSLSGIWSDHDFSERRATPLHPSPRKATTCVNSALNYGLAVGETAARITCYRAGLHPQIGMLHQSIEGSEGMVFDLQELTRGWVESAVLRWFEEPKHRSEFRRADDWSTVLTPNGARSLVETVAPSIDRATLLRDARALVRAL